MADFTPTPVKRGDVLQAELLNRMQAELARLGKIRGGAGLSVRQGGGGLQLTSLDPNNRYLAVANGNISARSGTTPGTGNVDVCWINPSGPTITNIGPTIAVYNPSSSTMTSGQGIDSGQYCWIEQDPFGSWIVAPLECS